MSAANKLFLRTVNQMTGIKDVFVDPQSSISCLREWNTPNCIFIYKNIILAESLPFQYYSMNDGDIICVFTKFNFMNTLSKVMDSNLINELDLEKQAILDRKFKKIMGNTTVFRKFASQQLKKNDAPNSSESCDFTFHMKASKPSNMALPRFW